MLLRVVIPKMMRLIKDKAVKLDAVKWCDGGSLRKGDVTIGGEDDSV